MITLGQGRDYYKALKTVDEQEVDLDLEIKRAITTGSNTATVYVASELVGDILATRYRECGWDVEVSDFTGDRLTSQVRIGVTVLTGKVAQ